MKYRSIYEEEIACQSMCESIICYGGRQWEYEKNNSYLENYIETFKSTEYNSHLSYYDKDYVENFGNAIKKYINDYDFTKLVLNKVGANKDIIDLIPKRFIEMPDTIKILANH